MEKPLSYLFELAEEFYLKTRVIVSIATLFSTQI